MPDAHHKSFAPSSSPEEQRLLEQITLRFCKPNEDGDDLGCVEAVPRVRMPWSQLFKLQDRQSVFEFKYIYQSLDGLLDKLSRPQKTSHIDLAYFFIIVFGIFQLISITIFDEKSGQTMDTVPFVMLFVMSAACMNIMSLPDSVPRASIHSNAAFVLISLFVVFVILLPINFLNLGMMKSSLILVVYLSRILRFRMAVLYNTALSLLFVFYSTAFHRALDALAAFNYSSTFVIDLVELALSNLVGLYACVVSIVRSQNTFGTLVENATLIRKNEEEGTIRKEWVRKVMPKIVVEPYEKFKFNQSLLRKTNTGLIVPYHEEYIFASMLFADIVNFTMMSAGRSASEVVHILNRIYGAFDISANRLQIEKIGTLGDCYYCVSGVPMTEKKRLSTMQAFASKESQRNQVYYVLCSVAMGLEMCEKIQAFNDSMGLPDEQRVDMRIGVHWGTLNAVILGASRYKFDIYSDDALMANEMESGGQKGHVRISFKCHYLLANNGCEIELSSYDFKDEEDPEYYSPEDISLHLKLTRHKRKLAPDGRGKLSNRRKRNADVIRASTIHAASAAAAAADDEVAESGLREKKFIETYSTESLKQAQISTRLQRCIVVWKRKDGTISPMTKKAFNREKVPFELTGVEGVASRKGYSEEDKAKKAQSERRVKKDAMEEASLIDNLTKNWETLKHLMMPTFTYLGYFEEITFEYLYRIRYFLPACHLGFEVARLSFIFTPLYDHVALLIFNAIFSLTCFFSFVDYFDTGILMLGATVFVVHASVVALLMIDGEYNVLNDHKQRATHRYCRLNLVDMRESVLLRLYYLLYDEKFFQGFQFILLSYPVLVLSLIGRNCAIQMLVLNSSDETGTINVNEQFKVFNDTKINSVIYMYVRAHDISMLSNILMHSTSFATNILNLLFKLVIHMVITSSLSKRMKAGLDLHFMLPEEFSTYSLYAIAFLLFCIPLTIFRQRAIRTEFFATYQSNKEMVKANEDKQKINRVIYDLYPRNIVPKLIAISNTDEKSMSIMEKALKGDFALHHENISPASVAFICLCTGGKSLAKWFRSYYPSQSASSTDTRLVGRQTAMEIVALNSILCAMDEELGRMQFIDKIKSYRDTYLAVSGLSMNSTTKQRSPKAPHIALMLYCLNLVHSKVPAFKQIEDQINTRARLTDKEAYDPSNPFRIRFKIGFCVGDLIAGTIGRDKPAFDCWGNTVNTSSRMYSNGAPDMIQCLVDTVEYLKEYFEFEPVCYKSIKGLGIQMTYAVKGLRLKRLRAFDNQQPTNE